MATLILLVGLPGAGKTTQARRIAARRHAVRLTPDEWMLPLFGPVQPPGRRDVVEGRLVWLALETIAVGTDVVLDFGLWGRDERSALRSLALSRGATTLTVYLPVTPAEQQLRIERRWVAAPHTTFVMTEEDVATWSRQFEEPSEQELAGNDVPGPPTGWASWDAWAADRWPSSLG